MGISLQMMGVAIGWEVYARHRSALAEVDQLESIQPVSVGESLL